VTVVPRLTPAFADKLVKVLGMLESAYDGEVAALCLQWPEVLDDWETRFCRSIAGQRRISAKQAAVLAKIIGKIEAFASAAGECA
jgi:hypothetical protein